MTEPQQDLGKRIFRGSLMTYGAFGFAKLVAFASTLLLARVLDPGDFGIVGYALVVVGFLDVLNNLGVTAALIYRQDIPDEDAGQVFVLAVAMACVLWIACWLLAPVAAELLGDDRVIAVTRVLGFGLVIDALGAVHSALLQRHLRFGRYALPDVVQSITKGVVAVSATALGAGYWGLVWGQLAGISSATVTNWCMYPWIPRLRVYWSTARSLLAYGFQILAVDVLGAVVLNSDNVVVGYLLGGAALGLYAVAFSVPQMLTVGLAVAISATTFPALARLQHDLPALRRQYLQVQRYSALVILPVGFGLMVTAPAFVHTFFRPVWWPMAPVMQALAAFTALLALTWATGDAFKAIGRPDLLWKVAAAQAPLLVVAVVVGTRIDGILGAAVAHLCVVVPFTALTYWLAHRVLGVEVAEITASMRTPAAATALMVVTTAAVSWIVTPHVTALMALLAEVVVGVVAYAVAVLVMDSELRQTVASRRQSRARRSATTAR